MSQGIVFPTIACAPSEGSEQPVPLRCLIRAFAGQSVVVKDPKRLQAGNEDSDQPLNNIFIALKSICVHSFPWRVAMY